MPFRSQAQRAFMYSNHPTIAKRWSAEFPNQGKLPKHVKKKKIKIVRNDKLKEYGNQQGNKIEINVRKHKGSKAELADTIKHELNHAKHPKASEKTIQKKTQIDMSKMSWSEKEVLTKKVRMKKLNWKGGALKRKFKMGPGKVEPGSYLAKVNESKVHKKTNPAVASDFESGVKALI
jgi:hypothetical protein